MVSMMTNLLEVVFCQFQYHVRDSFEDIFNSLRIMSFFSLKTLLLLKCQKCKWKCNIEVLTIQSIIVDGVNQI